jgi:hypothetical protein
MGSYIYRVTAKQVMCDDGKPANLAVYAYKPYGGWDRGTAKANHRMALQSGCYASEKLYKDGKLSGRIVFAHTDDDKKVRVDPFARVYEYGGATLNDDAFYEKVKPLEGVRPVRKTRPRMTLKSYTHGYQNGTTESLWAVFVDGKQYSGGYSNEAHARDNYDHLALANAGYVITSLED